MTTFNVYCKKDNRPKKQQQPHRRTDCIMKLLECQCKKQKIKTGDFLLNILSVSHELTELIIIGLCVHSSRNVPGQPRPLSAQEIWKAVHERAGNTNPGRRRYYSANAAEMSSYPQEEKSRYPASQKQV